MESSKEQGSNNATAYLRTSAWDQYYTVNALILFWAKRPHFGKNKMTPTVLIMG